MEVPYHLFESRKFLNALVSHRAKTAGVMPKTVCLTPSVKPWSLDGEVSSQDATTVHPIRHNLLPHARLETSRLPSSRQTLLRSTLDTMDRSRSQGSPAQSKSPGRPRRTQQATTPKSEPSTKAETPENRRRSQSRTRGRPKGSTKKAKEEKERQRSLTRRSPSRSTSRGRPPKNPAAKALKATPEKTKSPSKKVDQPSASKASPERQKSPPKKVERPSASKSETSSFSSSSSRISRASPSVPSPSSIMRAASRSAERAFTKYEPRLLKTLPDLKTPHLPKPTKEAVKSVSRVVDDLKSYPYYRRAKNVYNQAKRNYKEIFVTLGFILLIALISHLIIRVNPAKLRNFILNLPYNIKVAMKKMFSQHH
ncbi:unnamed protein product [Caenorhabditis auriculariae]|uniref:Uncharacterized protein n=1 Tax=Caenorhabditis auriculariae TaxID=2777116 RepID=A0A8S1GPP3_9PELO|nr:unnamed protein product [Caenorhabditis auriculariae]